MDAATYRQKALQAALDPNHPLHLLPNVPGEARKILDVGCHAGHILEALHLPVGCEAFGCDIDVEALELARQTMPDFKFSLGRAESLPYSNSSFDFVFARGVITATRIPEALRAFNRVLRMGGKVWISLHRWKDSRFMLKSTSDAHPVKALIVGAYVLTNSALFHYTGKLIVLKRLRVMTFQTERIMRRELGSSGFEGITFSRGQYFVVEAQKVRSLPGHANRGLESVQVMENRPRDQGLPVAS